MTEFHITHEQQRDMLKSRFARELSHAQRVWEAPTISRIITSKPWQYDEKTVLLFAEHLYLYHNVQDHVAYVVADTIVWQAMETDK